MTAVLERAHPPIAWTRLLPWLALLAALLWLFRDTGESMVSIWVRSETFQHAFLVPPISAWLAWRVRDRLALATPRPMPWVLLPMAGACLLWLMGELAAVSAASQFALVALVVLSVPVLYGWQVTRALLFPLAFLFFSVPIGEFLVPTLINHTADFTVSALRLTGIPVLRDGNDFVIPSGSWSVVEACSGVRYLIASLMVGTLFAYLNYRTAWRRWAFVGVAILVPIVANWLRAYMIVMIGHLSGNTLAVGADHLLYGWVFFGLVIGLMFFIGARWAEPDAPLPSADGMATLPAAGSGRAPWAMAAVATGLLVGAQAWLWQLDHGEGDLRLPTLALPAATGGAQGQGWQADPSVDPGWTPAWHNPSAAAGRGYRAGERTAWLWVGYYRNQGDDRKLVSSTNTLAGDRATGWVQADAGSRQVALAGGEQVVRTAELRHAHALSGGADQRLRVWQLYWVDGRYTAIDARAKVYQALARLRGRGDDGAIVVMATPPDDEAHVTLEAFARAQLPVLAAQFETIQGAR